MVDPVVRSGWRGINNRAQAKRLPDGYVRDMVNLDPLVGGTLGMRGGFTKVASATAARGCLAVRNQIVYADGDQLMAFNTDTNAAVALATIDGAGRLAGTVLNDELFLCTETELLRYDGFTLRAWGVPTVTAQPLPVIGTGGMAAGNYQMACTLVDAHGDEGATVNPLVFALAQGSSLTVTPPTPPTGGYARVYVGPAEGGTLYLQYEGTDPYTVSVLRDDTARLDLLNLRGPAAGSLMAARGGVIYCADGGVLWMSLPMRPHLRDAVKGFFQYSSDVSVVAAVDGGVYVAADKTWFISDTETQEARQTVKLAVGAVAGTQTTLPDGRVAWMTQYGLAIGDKQGNVQLISEKAFAPELAGVGASGMLEHNGNQMVVTTLGAQRRDNPLAASDYYDAEIVLP